MYFIYYHSLQLHLTTWLCPWTWHSTVAIQLELWWYPSLVIMWWRVPSLSLCLWHQQTVLSLWTHQPPLSPFRMMMMVSFWSEWGGNWYGEHTILWSKSMLFSNKWRDHMVAKFEREKGDENLPLLYKILIWQLHWIFFHCFSLSSVEIIGFDATAYLFIETNSTVSRSVSVSVQSGSLARDVVVTVQTVDGSATGGTLINRLHRWVVHVVSFSPSSFIWLHICVHGPDIQQWQYKPNCDDTHRWW